MPLFACPACTQQIDGEEAWAGLQVACPTCGAAIVVPHVSPYQAPAAARDPFATGMPRSGPASIPAEEKKNLWKLPLTCLFVAAGVGVVQYAIKPPNPLDALLGNDGPVAVVAHALGYALGAGVVGLVIALIAAGIAKACQRPFATTLSSAFSISVVVLVLLTVVGTLLGPVNSRSRSPASAQAEVRQARETMDGMKADLEKMQAGMTGPDGLPRQAQVTFDDSGKGGSAELDKMRRLMQAFYQDLAAFQNEYLQELDRARINVLLDPQRVAGDTDFSESYAILAKVRRTVKEFRKRNEDMLTDFPLKLKAASFSPSITANAVKEYEVGMAESLPVMKENWDIEEKSVDLMSSLIEHFDARRGHWVVEGGKFLFEETADLERFNSLLAEINVGVQRQAEIKERAQKKTSKALDDMKSMIQ